MKCLILEEFLRR